MNKLERDDIYEKITALIDGELNDENERRYIMNLISKYPKYKHEYIVQKKIKEAVKRNFTQKKAPSYLYEKVMNSIRGHQN